MRYRPFFSRSVVFALVSAFFFVSRASEGNRPDPGFHPGDHPRVVRIFFAGDVCPARNISGTHHRDVGFFTPRAEAFIRSHDAAVMNYETATAHHGARAKDKKFVFAASPESPLGLTSFDVAVVANNHVFDLFDEGWEATERALASAGIAATGVFENGKTYAPAILERSGRRIVLVSGTVWGSSSERFATNGPGGVERAVASARRTEPDGIVAAYIHGDVEYSEKTPVQEKWSKRFVAAGADMVLWSHSHVYGPVEEMDGAVVAYGLGNFIFGGNSSWKNRNGALGFSASFRQGEPPVLTPVRFSSRNYRIDLGDGEYERLVTDDEKR